MKQTQHGTVNDIRVAEYVCGLLKPEEHAQVHVLLSRDDQALALALAWEQDLLALVDALPRVQPPNALRERLQRTLNIGPPPASLPPLTPQLLRQPSREPGGAPAAFTPEPPAAAPQPATPAIPESKPEPAPVAPAPAQTVPEALAGSAYTHRDHQAAGLLEEGESEQDKTAAPKTSILPPPTVAARSPVQPEPEKLKSAQPPAQAAAADDSGLMRRLQRRLWLWRLIGICATGAAIAGFMRPSEPPPPPVQIVKVAPTRAAILQAPGDTSTPGWTATLGPEGNLMMQPLVHTEVPTGSQVLLWTRSERIPEPRLLGSINPNQPVQVPAAQLGALADDQLLEITLETDEDAARGQPHGPILFIGQMAVFGAEGVAAPASDSAASVQNGVNP